MPALVGSSKMPYPRFLIFNMIGGVLWGTLFTLGGYYTGEAFEHTAKLMGRWVAIAVALVAVIALAVWSIRKHRRGLSGEGLSGDILAAGGHLADDGTLAAQRSGVQPDNGARSAESLNAEPAVTSSDT
jgi:hypothetical protein